MEITFVLPLALLPGVALLIVSTSTRYAGLHDEIHHLLRQTAVPADTRLPRRVWLFREALTALYVCVALFALAALTGMLLQLTGVAPQWAVVGLTGLGCLCLLYAAVQLIREIRLSALIIEVHLRDLAARSPD